MDSKLNIDIEKDTKREKVRIMNGLACGVATMCFIGNPIACWMWFISVAERSTKYITQSTILLILCGVGALGSLAASIVAKVLDKNSRWAVANIVYISIVFVIGALLTWGFIALINTAL